MLEQLLSPRLILSGALFAVATLLPVTVDSAKGFAVSSLCGSTLTTCCIANFSTCPDQPGFYDSDCYGKCDELKCNF